MNNNIDSIKEAKSDTNRDEIRCKKYHEELVPGFVDVITQNITKRIKELLYIINDNNYFLHNNKRFILDVNEFTQNAMSFIEPIISEATIVQLNSCKKIPKSKNEYKKVARNRLNRNKPKFVGNYIFEPIIFNRLYQFCNDNFGNNSMMIFISILQDILSPHSVVRFDQTRAQPLIPYNTFVMDNKFRNSFITLLRHYSLLIEWENSNKKKNKKKETAKDKWESLVNICLPKLAQMVECGKHKNRLPPNKFRYINDVQFSTTVSMTPNDSNSTNNTNNNNNDEYKNITINNQVVYNNNNNNNNTYINCNQNQHLCNYSQPQPYCESSNNIIEPSLPPLPLPPIQSIMPNNSFNNVNNNYNMNDNVNRMNNYMDCNSIGDIDHIDHTINNTINNTITNRNNDTKYTNYFNPMDVYNNNNTNNFNACCNNSNNNNNNNNNNYFFNNNFNNDNFDNEFNNCLTDYNEDINIIETDFNMNDICQSPMDSSMFTNSTDLNYDYMQI